MDSVESFESISGQNCDEYYPPSTSFKGISNETASRRKREKKHLSSFAVACDRAQVSYRAAALLSKSLSEDYGKTTREDAENVIDKNKIRRA